MYVLPPDKNTSMLPIKCWASDLEGKALEQAEDIAKLPFAFRHVALMPDAHMGYGMPIGGVLATKGVIIPNAVGVDIGCGMRAMRTNIHYVETENIKKIMGIIRKAIPVGFNKHTEKQEWPDELRIQSTHSWFNKEYQAAAYQLGTLGGGNHFIELQQCEDGYLWVMIHSGSRHIGLTIAKEYHSIAQEHCKKWHSNIPCKDLAFLPIDTKEGQGYLTYMNWALDFARQSRAHMMANCLIAIRGVLASGYFEHMTDIHHNYAAMENHFGANIMLHRKGATSAREGQLGIIPGSQGTKSYIVEGLGNPESFMSCSHGAGRKMGRKAAQKELSLTEQKKILDDQGIVHGIRHQKDLDEAPGAYKSIQEVMNNQKDLVKIIHTLTPLGVIKG